MSQTLADYQVLLDSGSTLSENGEKEIEFTLPEDFYGNSSLVLAYMVSPSSGSAKEYEVDINDTVVDSATLSSAERRSMLEMIAPDRVRVGKNTLQFRFENGGGELTFHDVAIWYQRVAE